MFFKMCYNETNFVKGAQMRAKAIDYSTYSEQALFVELNSTKEQIAELENKKSQIEQALHSIPTDETADALKNAVSLPQYTSHEQLVKELQAEIAAENANNRH